MKQSCDVTIVGAGPAGATLAYELARKGIRVLLLEKEKLPRYKCCAGGVTSKTAALLDFDISRVAEDVVHEVSFGFNLGKTYLMVQPNLHDLLLNIRRAGTIMYPKDMGFILINMNIIQGVSVIEAGTGSGALTIMLALTVGPEGHVYSYDNRDDMQILAQRNLDTLGLSDRVTFKCQDIAYGFDQIGVDALFLDLPNPEDYIPVVRATLRPGGFFGSLLPTTNQVSRLLEALQAQDFAFIEVCEILLRYYKPVPARLRPDDRLVAHTGFLVFARPIIPEKNETI